jgi:hypothetical protein
MPRFTLRLCAGLVVFFSTLQTVNAQITNAEVERGLRFPGTQSWDGEAYTARYSYGLYTAPVYIGGNTTNLYYLDYLDRANRAAKFGYPMPVDPYFEAPPIVQEPLPVRVGIRAGGFGIFRHR